MKAYCQTRISDWHCNPNTTDYLATLGYNGHEKGDLPEKLRNSGIVRQAKIRNKPDIGKSGIIRQKPEQSDQIQN